MSKSALGKGIGALIRETKAASGAEENLPLSRILPNPEQPRKHFDDASLEDLTQSIREKGVLQPILVEKRTDETYVIIAGERRYRAAIKAGLASIPAIVREFTKQEKLEIALIENLQREDLTPIEEANAFKALIEFSQSSQDEIAKRLGKNRATIANTLRLLKLPEPMRDAIDKGTLSPGHARAILSVQEKGGQEAIFRAVIDRGISVREAEAMAQGLTTRKRAIKETPKPDKARQTVAELRDLEKRLEDYFGTKVAVKGSLEAGRIEISYYNRQDLDRIWEATGSR